MATNHSNHNSYSPTHNTDYMKPALIGYAHPRFWLFLPLFITIGGISALLLTRYVAYLYHPEEFARSLPTISKAASLDVATQLFAFTIPVFALGVIFAWYLGFLATRERITALVDDEFAPRLYLLNKIAVSLGFISAIFLALLAIISLEDNNDWHIYFSYGFFISQTLSFAFDSSVLLQIRKHTGKDRAKHGLGLDVRPWLSIALVINAL
ncbi:MAG TPA: hypothetical protein ENK06_06755, partial [Gammaproteobacteria bacterium]|nr:hypothetical protein [Gammaproteobacteria bacterium]